MLITHLEIGIEWSLLNHRSQEFQLNNSNVNKSKLNKRKIGS